MRVSNPPFEEAKTMEAPNNNDDDKTIGWSSETNWTIAHGSLNTSITFDSSASPIDSETVNLTDKSPLILKPPAPNCGPCEIKISFTQKHEVRQIYVRSSARVYEIYYAPSPSSVSEYLCTVRCGIVERDEEIVIATDTEEPDCGHLKGSAEEMAKEKFKRDSNISTNEDDWVEVKVPDALLQDNRSGSLPEKIGANTVTNIQDFYEATAEITDADPCTSLTIRLLSLQSKGGVYVDEIYVFADPIEPDDSENQGVQVGNSAESSLSAMLFPTLLQLSKTGFSRVQNKHASDMTESREIGSTVSHSTDNATITKHEEKPGIAPQQDVKLQTVNQATVEQPQFQIPTVLERERKFDSIAKSYSPYGQIERTLEQLVSRVTSVEDICLRFEENMLKPIRGIEARLQHVEQQLEVLSKNCHCSLMPSGTRISAPTFSCSESNSSSFYNDGSDYPASGQLESDKTKLPFDRLSNDSNSNPSDNMPNSVNDSRFHPSLVVTAPEFSCGDDEEDNDALEQSKDSPREKPKQALSIDDALAAALTGFLATTLGQPSNYTQALTVKAPEFTIEENGSDDEIASQNVQNQLAVVPSVSSCELTETEFINETYSTSRNVSLEDVGNVERDLSDEQFEETSKGVDEQCWFYDEKTAQAKHESSEWTETDDCQITEETNRIEASNEINHVWVSEKNDILKCFLGDQTKDGSGAVHEGEAQSTEYVSEVSEKEMLQNVFKSSHDSSVVDFDFKSSHDSSVVDFDTPILDVKFASSGNSSTKSPLEALLTGMPELDVEALHNQETDDVEKSDTIPTEDGELMVPLTVDHLLVDLESNDVREVPSTLEGEELRDSYICDNESSQEMFASLI